MNIYEVKIASSKTDYNKAPYAIATVRKTKHTLMVEILRSDPGSYPDRYDIPVHDDHAIYATACVLQRAMDGHTGTNSMVDEYRRLLEDISGR